MEEISGVWVEIDERLVEIAARMRKTDEEFQEVLKVLRETGAWLCKLEKQLWDPGTRTITTITTTTTMKK
jgi:hypothetical protein